MSEQTSKTDEAKKVLYKGSCHCKAIQYEIRVALEDPPIATRCNCTFCVKSGFTGLRMKKEELTFVSPGSLEEIPEYQSQNKDIHHRFCNKCGVQILGHGFYKFGGNKTDFFTLNILSLDQPQEGLDLSKLKMLYWDGLNNNWAAGQKEEPWAGGTV